MVLALGAALLHALTLFIPRDAHLRGPLTSLFIGELTPAALSLLLGNLVIVFFARQVLRFLRVSGGRLWYAGGLTWWAVQVVASVALPGLTLGQDGWLSTAGQQDQGTRLVFEAIWGAVFRRRNPGAFHLFYMLQPSLTVDT